MPTTDPLETRTYPTAEAAEAYALKHDLPFDNQDNWCALCRAYHVEILHSDAVRIAEQNEKFEKDRLAELEAQEREAQLSAEKTQRSQIVKVD